MAEGRARSAVLAGSLAACAIGLAGVDAGLLWIVAGVFTLRSIAGARPGLAWAIACTGTGLRWGTLGLGDLGTATRLLGASVLAGGPLLRIGMIATLVGAVADEARRGDLLSASWLEQAAAVVASVALVPVFLVPGPMRLASSAGQWAGASIGVLAGLLLLAPLVRRVPPWLPVVLVGAGLVITEAGG